MTTDGGEVVDSDLARHLKVLDIATPDDTDRTDAKHEGTSEGPRNPRRVLVLDAGYGFPREKKVRKEKINAISSQLSNFLVWQTGAMSSQYALVQVVGCPHDNIKTLLENRTIENMKKAAPSASSNSLPLHVTISCETLEECLVNLAANRPNILTATMESENVDEPVYLSPDAAESLDPCSEPPEVAIVGLLIDRRVQPNRSRDRANKIGIVARRWPLEDCFAEINSHEPLNVDCVLEGMQQWWWNWKDTTATCSQNVKRETFVQAASQAIEHHCERHPSRPLHIEKSH